MKLRIAALLNAASDSLALILSGFTAYQLRTSEFFVTDNYIRNPQQYLLLLAFALLTWHLIIFFSGGYRQGPEIFKIDELLFHFKASFILIFILMGATFLYKSYDYSRLVIFFSWLFLIFIGNIGRQVSFWLQKWLHKNKIDLKTAVIRGSDKNLRYLKERIENNPGSGLSLIEIPKQETLSDFIKNNYIDELFLSANETDYQKVWQLREASANKDIRINLIPTISNLYLRNVKSMYFDGTVLLSLESPYSKKFHFLLKRIFDIVFSVVFLILLFPLFFLCALLIKIDSRGPVIFKQKRAGLEGSYFYIFKFRTMTCESPIYAETPREKKDPRITATGRLLRASGLDELPQLFNVIKGEMSVVGPRPEMPFIAEKYTELEKKRLKFRPGITGLWQIYARSENLPIHHHIEYDLYYIENFSILIDLIIILETIPTAIMSKGI
ncbi:MAG: exopolysaccharide biosynthesis polyprenyl glycosylphosphotransferase [Candidatus Rifleibacteriota bacterium]